MSAVLRASGIRVREAQNNWLLNQLSIWSKHPSIFQLIAHKARNKSPINHGLLNLAPYTESLHVPITDHNWFSHTLSTYQYHHISQGNQVVGVCPCMYIHL